jgi:hypothetical protein
LWPKAACPWVVRISLVSLHTRFRAFSPQRPDQHLLPPSPMCYICATVASTFILRRCAPATLFVCQARRLFERACRTGAGAITQSTHARSVRTRPSQLSAHSILRAKALPGISGNLLIKSTHGYIFYLRRCEIFSGLLLRSVHPILVDYNI